MSLPLPLHSSRLTVLYELRHSPAARYTDLMQAAGLESDAFKFHLRVLVQNRLVEKNDNGTYSLTSIGKEFANDLDEHTGQRTQSPKLSILFVASRQESATRQYLFHQRLRHPFYGYWGLISAPVIWGKTIEECARDELVKQTGLRGALRVHGFCRVRDYSEVSHSLLEDKLFAIVIVDDIYGVPHEWKGGVSRWMTQHELENQSKRFMITGEMLMRIERKDTYFEIDNIYALDDY